MTTAALLKLVFGAIGVLAISTVVGLAIGGTFAVLDDEIERALREEADEAERKSDEIRSHWRANREAMRAQSLTRRGA